MEKEAPQNGAFLFLKDVALAGIFLVPPVHKAAQTPAVFFIVENA